MPRRKKDDGEVNLDSLMDALTNVVAVLILVLMLVQIDVVKTVVELQDDLEPATDEMIEEQVIVLKKLEDQLKKQDEQKDEKPPTPEEIEEEERRLALLEESIETKQELLADVNELKELEKKAREARDVEQEETVKLQDEIARLEAALDDTPVIADIAPVEVTIPNSRPIPDNAKKYIVLCRKDRIHFIDIFTPLEYVEKEFSNKKNKWFVERIKKEGKDRKLYDQLKAHKDLNAVDYRNTRNQKTEVINIPHGGRLLLRVSPDLKEGGIMADQLQVANSPFLQICKKLAFKKENIVFFYVNSDGFNTYLMARKLADAARLPAGWEVNGAQFHQVAIEEFEVKRIADPPEPKSGPATKKPPRLGPKLD